ncbi:hypothetical protein XA68_13978 [Ophiocordyceps unilateralis]|uniref:Uncharacterized protein n=1 Tax=Ophiocordyceps unilateralis TaxID=268505 RepID=A0A2A9P9Q5_OPHUN|nr:hypothetical protein XA68_13978 [Ophiocordyceps unilateralis]
MPLAVTSEKANKAKPSIDAVPILDTSGRAAGRTVQHAGVGSREGVGYGIGGPRGRSGHLRYCLFARGWFKDGEEESSGGETAQELGQWAGSSLDGPALACSHGHDDARGVCNDGPLRSTPPRRRIQDDAMRCAPVAPRPLPHLLCAWR